MARFPGALPGGSDTNRSAAAVTCVERVTYGFKRESLMRNLHDITIEPLRDGLMRASFGIIARQ